MSDIVIRDERDLNISWVDKIDVSYFEKSGAVQIVRVSILGDKAQCDLIRLEKDEIPKLIKALKDVQKEA